MKTKQRISMMALMALFLISTASCRQPDDDYNYEENDEPLTAVFDVKAAIKLAMI